MRWRKERPCRNRRKGRKAWEEKRANRQPGRVTGKEGAIHLDDWLDGPEDDYIDFEDNPAYSGTGGSMGINRKLTRREKKAMEKAAKEAEKLRKIQEEADRKAKLKAAREAEKAAKERGSKAESGEKERCFKEKSTSGIGSTKIWYKKCRSTQRPGYSKREKNKGETGFRTAVHSLPGDGKGRDLPGAG